MLGFADGGTGWHLSSRSAARTLCRRRRPGRPARLLRTGRAPGGRRRCAAIRAAGFVEVEPFNPYWRTDGPSPTPTVTASSSSGQAGLPHPLRPRAVTLRTDTGPPSVLHRVLLGLHLLGAIAWLGGMLPYFCLRSRRRRRSRRRSYLLLWAATFAASCRWQRGRGRAPARHRPDDAARGGLRRGANRLASSSHARR